MTYSCGRTYQTAAGWFAEWAEDAGKLDAAIGPYRTEAGAAGVFFAE